MVMSTGISTVAVTSPIDDSDQRTVFIALWALGAGLSVLLVGVATPHERLSVLGIPVNPLIFGFALLSLPICRAAILSRVLLWMLPLALCLSLSLLWSQNVSYGVSKGLNFLAATLLSAALFGEAIAQLGLVRFMRWMIAILLVFLAAAVVFKLRSGFFERQGLFFMNGPIVFARLMGIAAIFTFFGFRGLWRWALILLFFAAMVWTQSKGPVIALGGSATFAFVLRGWSWRRALALLVLVGACSMAYINREIVSEVPVLKRYVVALDFGDARNKGSLHYRQARWEESWALITAHPLIGVGLGGNVDAGAQALMDLTGENQSVYPHNIVLEVVSEMGLLLGTAFMIPFFLFLRSPTSALGVTALFMLLASMVSGDLLDARYAAVFAILTAIIVAMERQAATQPQVMEACSGEKYEPTPAARLRGMRR